MGRDKRLLEFAGQPLQEHCAAVLRQCFTNVIILTQDDVPGLGPLGGIVTALRRAPAIFVVACDMPFVDADLIRLMAGQLAGYDAVAVPREPLHACYSASALPVIDQQIATGDYSVHRLLARLRVKYLSAPDFARYPVWQKSFTNVNTPQEWETIQHGR